MRNAKGPNISILAEGEMAFSGGCGKSLKGVTDEDLQPGLISSVVDVCGFNAHSNVGWIR